MKASVIVVNWNGRNYLKICLDSLRDQTFKDFEIILVDNASTDGSVEFVKKGYPDVTIVQNKENRGFAGGNNDGVRVAKGDIIVLLNNDVKVNHDWLEELIEGFEDIKADIAFSFVMSKYSGEYTSTIGATTVLGHAVAVKDCLDDVEKGSPIESCFAGGCTMTFKRSVGLPFDEDYFLYSEDVHFSWKTRMQGGKIFLVPSSLCYHEGEGSSKSFKEKSFYQQRNRLMNLFIFYEKKTLLKLTPLLIFNMIATGFRDFPYRWKANLWLLKNWHVVGKKREEIQALRKIPDSEITPLMSGKFFDGFPILNKLHLAYLKMVGVKTLEES